MNIRESRKYLVALLVAGISLPALALANPGQTSGSSAGRHGDHGGSSGGGSHNGSGSHGGSGGSGHSGGSGNHGDHGNHGGNWGHHSSGWRGGLGLYGGWYYPSYGWYGSPGYWGGGGGWGYTNVYPSPGATHGALDLDVSPENAQVFIDGELVGVADDFDGFPDFLWLEKGAYDVVIFAPGYQTISRQISIYPGLVIDVDDSMTPGKETLPQDLGSKSTVNRDERLRRDRENEQEIRAHAGAPGAPGDRYERRPEPAARGEAGGPSGGPGRSDDGRLDARGEPGSLVLHVVPEDASVYLDGRFLGTGREMARLRGGLIVDPGSHRLEVVRPGRQSEEKEFSVGAGEEVRLDISLDEE
ncbi:MAG: PEGA domain-containing protein [Thermoanaerobaculia bacterium]